MSPSLLFVEYDQLEFQVRPIKRVSLSTSVLVELNQTKVMKISDKKVFIGCDISKKTLDYAVHRRDCHERDYPHVQTENNLAGFRAFKKWLKTFCDKLSDVVVILEHTGHYGEALCDYLAQMNITFVLVNPTTIKASFAIAKGKDDKIDSQRLAKYGYKERDDLKPSMPTPPIIRKLRNLLSERRAIVKSKVACINRCKTVDKKSETYKRGERIVKELRQQVRDVEEEILRVIESDVELRSTYNLLRSINSIGIINAVSTIVATENFRRFNNAREYASFICVAPYHHLSGISVHGQTRVSKKGHSELKTDLTMSARAAIQYYPEFQSYFVRKRAEGKSYGSILNAVKFKLITRMFAVIKRNAPYADTHKHMAVDPAWREHGITDNVSLS